MLTSCPLSEKRSRYSNIKEQGTFKTASTSSVRSKQVLEKEFEKKVEVNTINKEYPKNIGTSLSSSVKNLYKQNMYIKNKPASYLFTLHTAKEAMTKTKKQIQILYKLPPLYYNVQTYMLCS